MMYFEMDYEITVIILVCLLQAVCTAIGIVMIRRGVNRIQIGKPKSGLLQVWGGITLGGLIAAIAVIVMLKKKQKKQKKQQEEIQEITVKGYVVKKK